jgi:hypothetical protein
VGYRNIVGGVGLGVQIKTVRFQRMVHVTEDPIQTGRD